MRTIIRLQRKGPKHLYTNKMAVQGSYKLLKGKVIENLGFWAYKKMDYHKRSLILNRARARYWLAMGAVLSPKVQRWFNAFNMWCPPYVKWGKSTAPSFHHDESKNFIRGFNDFVHYKKGIPLAEDEIEARINAQSARNVYFRRFKYREQLKNYLDETNPEEFLESIIGQTKKESQDETIFERSQKYYHLKRFYDDLERHPKMIAPYKKELLYNKMNELAEDGLLTEEETVRERKELHLSPKLDSVERAMALDWEKRKQRSKDLLAGIEKMFSPLKKEEFVGRCRERTNLNPRDFDNHMEDFLRRRNTAGGPLTLLDVEQFLKSGIAGSMVDMEDFMMSKAEEDNIDLDEYYLPSKFSVTPEPDLTVFDPRDWYDLREQTTDQIHGYSDPTDRWYDLPLSEGRRYKINTDMIREHTENAKETVSNMRAEPRVGITGVEKGYILRRDRRLWREKRRQALKAQAEEQARLKELRESNGFSSRSFSSREEEE